MDARTKSIVRKLRRMVAHNSSKVEDLFAIGKLASALIPAWVETDHELFEEFLQSSVYLGPEPAIAWWSSRRRPSRSALVAKLALTYYEVPSLAIWQQLGYRQTAVCADYSQACCRDIMMENGVSLLDLIMMEI